MSSESKYTGSDDISLGDIVDFIFRIKYWLLVSAIAAGIGAAIQRSNKPRFQTTAVIRVEQTATSPLQALSEKLTGIGGSVSSTDNTAENTRLFFISNELYRHVAQKIVELEDFAKIQKDLGARPGKDESAVVDLAEKLSQLSGAEVTSKDTIKLWVNGNTPDTTITVVNLLLNEGVTELAKNNIKELTEATKFVTQKLDSLEKDIQSRQNEVLDLRKKIGLGAGQTDLSSLSRPASKLRETLASAKTELKQRERLLSEVSERLANGHNDYATVAKYEKIEDERKFWAATVKSLSENVKDMEHDDKGATSIEQAIFNTTREIEFMYKYYGELKNQLLQTEMMKISIVNRIRPMEAGTQASTFRTSSGIDYLFVAAMFAMILTALGLFALEAAYPKVRNRGSLDFLPIFFLGEVPDFGKGKIPALKKVLDANPIAPEKMNIPFFQKIFEERIKPKIDLQAHLLWKSLKAGKIFDSPETMVFRTLRSKLLHLNNTVETGVKVVCITSARPDSGKTMITSNLACLLAIAKKKTLIIDCDLRRGSTTIGFELQGKVGLTDFLHGEVNDWNETIQSYTADLDVIPRGTQLLNPAELLSDERFTQILDEAKKRYDYILLDTSPILGIAETDIVTKSADLVILAIVQQETKIVDVKYTVDHLTFNDIKRIGYVLNRSGQIGSDAYFVYSKVS
jgi:tyrosine-protein kinase Etk/Wzc